jgi:hypothetical protein
MSPSYYGPVTLSGALNEGRAKHAVPGEVFNSKDTTVHSWGPFVVVYQKNNILTRFCPKKLITELAMRIMGKKRDPDSFKQLLVWAAYNAKSYNIPPTILDDSLFACVSLAFIKNVASEASSMHEFISPSLPVIKVFNDSLDFKFKTVWNVGKVAAAVGATALTAGCIAKSSLVAGALSVVAPVAIATTAAAVSIGAAPVVLAAAGIYAAKHYIDSPPAPNGMSSSYMSSCTSKQKRGCVLSQYRIDRSSDVPQTRVVHLDACVLPSTKPPVSIPDLLDIPLDVTAKLVVKDPLATRDKSEELDLLSMSYAPTVGVNQIYAAPLHLGGIGCTFSVPVVPSNDAHSMICSLVERVLKPQPFHDPTKFSPAFFDKFEAWIFKYMDELFPGMVEEPIDVDRDMPFAEWNSPPRFPQSQCVAHELALKQFMSGDFNDTRVSERGIFVKLESLPKSTQDGVPKLAPRAIQSGSRHHNVVTGPFCLAGSKRLAKAWSVHNDGGLMYTSGANSEDIGAAFKRAFNKCPGAAFLEGDFVRFDSTIHRRFLELEVKLFKLLMSRKGLFCVSRLHCYLWH